MQNIFGALQSGAGIASNAMLAKSLTGAPQAGGGGSNAVGSLLGAIGGMDSNTALLSKAGTTNDTGTFDEKSLNADSQSFLKSMEAINFNPTLNINPFQMSAPPIFATQYPTATSGAMGGKDFYNPQ
jgi:hypothetical protein